MQPLRQGIFKRRKDSTEIDFPVLNPQIDGRRLLRQGHAEQDRRNDDQQENEDQRDRRDQIDPARQIAEQTVVDRPEQYRDDNTPDDSAEKRLDQHCKGQRDDHQKGDHESPFDAVVRC